MKTGDYHDDMNFVNYEKWVRTQLLPNLPPHSVVVIDNAAYHNKLIDPAPNANAKKELMKKWLLEKGISVEDNMRKPQLYDLIKKNKDAHKKFTIDELFHANNHSVLRLPPYHPDLNPIEMAWAAIKGHVATKNVEWNIARTMELVKEKVNEMGQAEWSALCRKVKEVEETYRRSDYVIDEMTEQFIINTENDTESESESDDDAEDENTPQPSTSTSGAEDNFMAGISRIDDYSDSD